MMTSLRINACLINVFLFLDSLRQISKLKARIEVKTLSVTVNLKCDVYINAVAQLPVHFYCFLYLSTK